MKYKNILLIAIIQLFICNLITAQEFIVPKNLVLVEQTDFENSEKDVIAGINWLEKTKVTDQIDKRKETNTFLLKWMMGTPTFSIALNDFQTELTAKNPDLLITFLGGWTKFAIENPSEKDDPIKANMAAFQSLMKVYELNKGDGIKKDKKIEKLIKLSPSDLQAWIEKNLK